MINEALEFIRQEVREHLALTDGEVRLDSARVLTSDANTDGIALTLINVEEEPALRNTDPRVWVDGELRLRQPSVFLNLYLLLAFDFPNYGMSLLNMSRTVALFQHRRVFLPSDGSAQNPWPDGLVQLAFEHHNMSFEALNNLWSVLGGIMLPSVSYKIRVVEIHEPDAEVTPVPISTFALELGS